MSIYTPYSLPIASISQAQAAVVGFDTTHPYTLGEVLSFRVSAAYGMRQMDYLEGRVIGVQPESVTMDIDSLQFWPFSIPDEIQQQPAMCIPVGAGKFPGSGPPRIAIKCVFDNKPVY